MNRRLGRAARIRVALAAYAVIIFMLVLYIYALERAGVIKW